MPSGEADSIDTSVALSELSLAVGIRHGHFVAVGVTWEIYRKPGESGGKAGGGGALGWF